MSFLIDTNVISELRKGYRAHLGVLGWFDGVRDEELFTSVLVLGELRRGVESVRRRDPIAAAALEQWLARLEEQFADRILPVDRRTADRWGLLNVPDPVPTVDGLLAATALAHELTLVTRNTRDVARTGVSLLNPFDP
ncbi:MAG: type II toxin-antitoxin system VapC family toxin [Polyangiaceae bacterium]|nr:type II toxin-antitoxin system VapC family toxin [Polyangiaceae bacterium]